jgi:hypothetical protein
MCERLEQLLEGDHGVVNRSCAVTVVGTSAVLVVPIRHAPGVCSPRERAQRFDQRAQFEFAAWVKTWPTSKEGHPLEFRRIIELNQ